MCPMEIYWQIIKENVLGDDGNDDDILDWILLLGGILDPPQGAHLATLDTNSLAM